MEGIRLPDYLVILAYFAVIIGAGQYFARYIRRSKDYFAAGNVMPWWLAGTSFYKASFSALLFVIYNEIAYKYGVVAIVIMWILPICVLVAGFGLARRWRRSRVITPLGFMERRYNGTVHQVFVWTGLPLRVFDDALKILSASIIFAVALRSLGLTLTQLMIIIGAAMILYSFRGGQMAIIITDFVNVSILGLSTITLFVLTLRRVGSVGDLIHRFPPGFLRLAPEPYGWSYLVFTVFLVTVLTYGASWALVQKYNTLKSETEIRKMIFWIAGLMFIMPPIFFFPGLAARVLMPAVQNPKEVYALISLKILPVGLVGFILSAVIGSTMSTLGSEFNTLSGVLTRDFYKKKIDPGLTEKGEILVGRAFTAVIGILTVLLAILFNTLQGFNLMDIMFRIFGAFGPATMLPLILGLLSKKFNARGTLWGLTAGSLTGIVLAILNVILVQKYAGQMAASPALDFWLRSGWNSAATVLSAVATIAGMAWGTAGRVTPADEKARVDAFFEDLRTPFLYDEKGERIPSPFRIIGVLLLALGLGMAVISLVFILGRGEMRAFGVNAAVILALLALGALMRFGGRRRQSADPEALEE